jgi:hypothetical protein
MFCYVPQLTKAKIIDASKPATGGDSLHKDICLNIGGESFGFLTPGLYRVRASFQYRGASLVSNVLEVYVRYPTPAVENLIVPLIDADVATYLAFRGVAGLSRARNRFSERFLDDDDTPRADTLHPLQCYFHAYEAMVHIHEGSKVKKQKQMNRLFANALGLAKLSDLTHRARSSQVFFASLPFSNIALAKVGCQIWKALKTAKEESFASALAAKLHDALQERGVPQHVRKRCLPDLSKKQSDEW